MYPRIIFEIIGCMFRGGGGFSSFTTGLLSYLKWWHDLFIFLLGHFLHVLVLRFPSSVSMPNISWSWEQEEHAAGHHGVALQPGHHVLLHAHADHRQAPRQDAHPCLSVIVLKGLSHEIDFINVGQKFTELGLNKGRGWFLNFPEAPLIF